MIRKISQSLLYVTLFYFVCMAMLNIVGLFFSKSILGVAYTVAEYVWPFLWLMLFSAGVSFIVRRKDEEEVSKKMTRTDFAGSKHKTYGKLIFVSAGMIVVPMAYAFLTDMAAMMLLFPLILLGVIGMISGIVLYIFNNISRR